MARARTYIGIFLVTMSVLMLELGLTRLFSATMFYHFAFLAISLALLGSAASGLFVYFFQRRLPETRTGTWLAVASALYSSSVLLALQVILANPLAIDGGPDNPVRLLAIYLATTLPFFFAGCTVSLAITRLARDVSRLYLFDLAGAAAGCLLLIPVLNSLGAINAVLLVAVIGAVAAVVLGTVTPGGRWVCVASLVLATALALLLVHNQRSKAIDVRVSKGLEEGNILFARWNSFSRVTVSGDPDGSLRIRIDADAAAHVARPQDFSSQAGKPKTIRTLGYLLKPGANALVIGAGGGRDVAGAIACGARSIVAVEINPIIARDIMSSEPFLSHSGRIFEQPGVRLVVDEGRSFIRSSSTRYDVIQAAMVDTWAATAAGAFALTENNIYTVEAFEDYARHLTDDGILSVTRWYFDPPDQPLRLIAVARAMMSELGIANPERHLMLVRELRGRERTPATLLFKRSEFTAAEVRSVLAIADEVGFDPLYTPLTRPDNVFTRLITAADPASIWDAHPTNVAPVWDNSPFFFNSLRLSNLGDVFRGNQEWRKTNLGTFVLFLLLGITATLVAAFVFGPLLFVHGRTLLAGGGALNSLLYFGCLGAGFIIVEVAMVQKFILFLGHPVYALAVVLFSLLLFSALGSWWTARFPEQGLRRSLLRVLWVLSGLVVVYVLVIPPVFYGLVHLALPLRIAIAVALIAPLAVLMGMPMPSGIRMLAASDPELVPWAWGVNGATSVLGSAAALVIAILSGFNQALLVGAALYLLAGVIVARRRAS